jgi:hypothetical protein
MVLIVRTGSQERVNCAPTGQCFDMVDCRLQVTELDAWLCAEPQGKCVSMDTTAAGNIKDLQGPPSPTAPLVDIVVGWTGMLTAVAAAIFELMPVLIDT